MIRHIWSVLCRRSVVDVESNTISLFDCIEEVGVTVVSQSSQRPIALPLDATVVVLVCRDSADPCDGAMRLRFVGPDGQRVMETQECRISLREHRRLRHRFNLQGLPFGGNGTNFVEVLLKQDANASFEPIARIPYDVRIEQARGDQTGTPQPR